MLSRRRFATCAICAAGGVLMAEVGARAQAPGFTRTVLNRIEYPGDKMVTVQILVEIDPNFMVARHTHPGVETGYFLEGGGTFGMKGAPDRKMAQGDAFQVPYEVPHFVKNGPAKTRVLSIYVVEKDKPLASPAPE
jgi:quercetin dioxygenase-like cupin family protein